MAGSSNSGKPSLASKREQPHEAPRQSLLSDHREILKQLIRRKIKCPDTLWLIDTIINASNPQVAPIEYFSGDDLFTPFQHPQGLPIGNLTSQFFANVYLNGFDHYIKETLQIKKYVRYMDDFALFSDDRPSLAAARTALECYLATLRLKIHPIKSQCTATTQGLTFLGFQVFDRHIRIRAKSLSRIRKRLKQLQYHYAQGSLRLPQVHQSLQSWQAHLNHGDTWRLQIKLFNELALD